MFDSDILTPFGWINYKRNKKWQFRGKTFDDEFVFGDLLQDKIGTVIQDEFGDTYRVIPSTVAQYVGIDSNGNDLYEDDIVLNSLCDEYKIGKKQSFVTKDGFNILPYDTLASKLFTKKE